MSNASRSDSASALPLPLGKRLLFSVVLIVLVLGVLEGLAAVFFNFFAANPRPLAARNAWRHVYEPYRNHALTPGFNSEGRIHNSQGFRRSTEVSTTKAANGYRIFLMGGSAAYGLDSADPYPPVIVTNKQTIDYKLEGLLQPLFPDKQIEVINAAVTAYWTHHHLIYLYEKILDYHPDLIIFMDGINDYYHDQPDHQQFLSYHYSMTEKTDELNHPRPIQALHTLLLWGKQYSYAIYALSEAADRLFRWDDVPADPCLNESIPPKDLTEEFGRQYEAISRRTWVRMLRGILLTLNDQGVAVITSLQPELVFPLSHGRSAGDQHLLEIEMGFRPRYYTEKKEFLRPLARKLAAETAQDLGATFVDLTDVFDDRAQYFIDYCHLSEAGAERVAERLLPFVVERIRHAPGHGSVAHFGHASAAG